MRQARFASLPEAPPKADGVDPKRTENRSNLGAEPITMNPDLLSHAEQWSHLLLEWVGFGTLVGLLAKAIMPGRDPGGALVTLALGIGGTVVGLGALTFFYEGQRVTPISVLGLAIATAGAFVLLLLYRLLAGRFFVEGEVPLKRKLVVPRRIRPRERTDYVDVE
jgi:uncharacterized membrane protein YeaQ/YmgE (transglycosylase-associated protein family)